MDPYRLISADTVSDGSINKAYTAAERTVVAGAAALVKPGTAKFASGTKTYGVPGVGFNSQGTSSFTAARTYYLPFRVISPVVLSDWEFEVTTAPASNANLRHGVFLADGDHQPSGNPLWDSGDTAVASAFTGIKSGTGMALTLPVGLYVQAVAVDVDMTLRALNAPTTALISTLGTAALYSRFYASESYAALRSPGTKWTVGVTSATAGLPFPVFYKWTE